MLIFLATYIYTIVMDVMKSVVELIFIKKFKDERPLQILSPDEACIIIPCHNSEDTIVQTLSVLPSRYKVFLVANGCTDRTEEILKEYCEQHPNAVSFSIAQPGKMLAFYVALLRARQEGFTHALMIDDDISMMGLHGDYHLMVSDKKAPVTAFPVLPRDPQNWLEIVQHIEYQFMCASKKAQNLMGLGAYGGVSMASGAGACYRIDVALDVLKDHSGDHIGDDYEFALLAWRKGYKIDYVPEFVIATVPPSGFIGWFKQRAGRWERSPIKNMRLAVDCLLGLKAPLHIRWILIYSYAARINDVLRLISAPIALIYYPEYFVGLLFFAYLCMILKMKAYRHAFYYRPMKFNILFPIYTQMMWVSRLFALPAGIHLLFKKKNKLGHMA